jgi:hypothetical protein
VEDLHKTFADLEGLDPSVLELHRRSVVADTHNDLLGCVVLRPAGSRSSSPHCAKPAPTRSTV